MPLLIMTICDGPKRLKGWYARNVAETSTVQDVYEEFRSGDLDRGKPIADKYMACKVVAKFGRTEKETLIEMDPETLISDATCAGMYVCFCVGVEHTAEESNNENVQCAFSMLMESSRNMSFVPAAKENPFNNKIKLSNHIIQWLKDNLLGWSTQCAESVGRDFVDKLTDVLWYIDGHKETLSSRSHSIPDMFLQFQGYNQPEKHKHRKRKSTSMNSNELADHASTLFTVCGSSYMKSKRPGNAWISVREQLLRLADNLRLHSDYLKKQLASVNDAHNRKERRTDEYDWLVYTAKNVISPTMSARYKLIHDALLQNPSYTPIFLNDFLPTDARRRFDYIEACIFPCKTIRFSYTGVRQHLHFVWKVDANDNESEQLQKNEKVSTGLKKDFPKYFSRAMKQSFMTTFGRVTKLKSAVLRKMFKELTGDCSSAANTHEEEIDRRLQEVIDAEDETLIWDLRLNNNGRPEEYLPFLERCQQYIESSVQTAVCDRRHDVVHEGEVVTHMATALNAQDLYNQVAKNCPEDMAIPSLQWLRWQFWPRKPTSASARRYTGRLKVKYMIMARQFREEHIDSHYASALWRYQKEFSVQFREHTSLVCQDDKHTVKVGEPGLPLAAAERGKQVLVGRNQSFQVADHDFSKFSLSPSVSMKIDIPENMIGSFYRGEVYVGLKENAFEPSSCLRHLAELKASINLNKPVECHYHDGGPDHNVRHMRNKLANIAYFLHCDLDMLSSLQTPPKHSWKNPAERCMSILNIGLQGVGLMRDKTATCEAALKNVGNLSGIRNLEEKEPSIRQEVKAAIQPVKDLLGDVFSRLKLKDEPIKTFQAASAENLLFLAENLKKIDADFDVSVLLDTKKKVKALGEKMESFIAKHCKQRHYLFSTKRCGEVNCVCGQQRLPKELFDDLHHLPDPAPSTTEADKYVAFQDCYGKVDNQEADHHLPSKVHKGNAKHGMPFAPSAQFAKNTKIVIQCDECQRWRCLYSKKVLKGNERQEVSRKLELLSYSCGAALSSIDMEDDDILARVHLNQKLTCNSPMEIPYYVTFPEEPLCFDCGTCENFDHDASKWYPLCTNCKALGRKPTEKRTRAFKPRD